MRRPLSGLFAIGASLELRQVAVIIALHLEVEDLGVAGGGGGDESGVKGLEDSIADVGELRLDLGSVVSDHGHMVLVAMALFLLLDRGDDAPQGSPYVNHVLVRHGEKVSLLNSELLALHRRQDLLRELLHLHISLGMYTFSSQAEGVTTIVFDWWFDLFMWVSDCRIGGLMWLDQWVSDLFTCCYVYFKFLCLSFFMWI